MPFLAHLSPFTLRLSPTFALTSSTWDNLSDGVAILIIAALLVVGLFLGYALRAARTGGALAGGVDREADAPARGRDGK